MEDKRKCTRCLSENQHMKGLSASGNELWVCKDCNLKYTVKITNNNILNRSIWRSIWLQIICIILGFVFFGGVGFLAQGIKGLTFTTIAWGSIVIFGYAVIFLIVMPLYNRKNKKK